MLRSLCAWTAGGEQAKASLSCHSIDIPEGELREELRTRLKRIATGVKGKKVGWRG